MGANTGGGGESLRITRIPSLKVFPYEILTKSKRVAWRWRNLVGVTLTKWSPWLIGRIKSTSTYLLRGCTKGSLASLLCIPAQSTQRESNYLKKCGRTKSKGFPYIKWPVLFKYVNVMKYEERFKNYSRLKEIKKTCKLNETHDLGFLICLKNIIGATEKNLNKGFRL